tara:strand:+ start:2632 stop:2811 length:180 start_codon:yes stop_codon:yes gene_type:complete
MRNEIAIYSKTLLNASKVIKNNNQIGKEQMILELTKKILETSEILVELLKLNNEEQYLA